MGGVRAGGRGGGWGVGDAGQYAPVGAVTASGRHAREELVRIWGVESRFGRGAGVGTPVALVVGLRDPAWPGMRCACSGW